MTSDGKVVFIRAVKKVLVIPPYGIGDALMSTPAVRNLKEQMDVEITYLHMFKTTRDILLNNPYITENIHFPFLQAGKLDIVRFMMKFRKRYDVTINFYPSNRKDYNLASFITASPVRMGHRYLRRDLREMNFLKNTTVKEDDGLHNVEENLRLLDFLGIKERVPYPMEICLTGEERRFAGRWLKAREIEKCVLIGLHPGASTFKNHGKKKWPDTSFAGLIDRLSQEIEGTRFLLFGGPEEKSLRENIMSMIADRKRVFSVDNISVRQTASLMRDCALFVSNDSGPMHMAAASGVPVVAIFGPTNPRWVGPWGVNCRIIRADLPCSPCFRYSPRPIQCPNDRDHECISKVAVDDVLSACLELVG